MKKLLSIASVLLVAAILTVASFAATISSTTSPNNTATGDVTVNSKDSSGNEISDSDITKVYSVDVSFGTLAFEYKFNATKDDMKWNPEKLKYVKAADGTDLTGAWTSTSANIVVSNKSNAGVTVSATFPESKTSITTSGVTATIATVDSTSLKSAVGASADKLPKVTYSVTVSGQPTTLDLFKVGTVTVTISSAS